ncbi:hypothetical protein IPJ72_01500 [Candidatus Peregrinibacteria bacterium]|nr:MAG: hypothetical protein IPJ72_01500 [Candidatus Peregrinibacteria bacterium]
MKLSRMAPLALVGALACGGEQRCPQGKITVDAVETYPQRQPVQRHLIDVTFDDSTRPVEGNPTHELWREDAKKPSAVLNDQPIEVAIANAGDRTLILSVRLTASATLADSQGFPDGDPDDDELFKQVEVLATGKNPELIGCPEGTDCTQTVDTSTASGGALNTLLLGGRKRLETWLRIMSPTCR